MHTVRVVRPPELKEVFDKIRRHNIITGATVLGVSLGISTMVVKAGLEYREWTTRRRVGYNMFPTMKPEELVDHFDAPIPSVKYDDCYKTPPSMCNASLDCQQACGPNFSCQLVTENIIYNNTQLVQGSRYCLPQTIEFGSCYAGGGTIIVTYDYDTGKGTWLCSCKFGFAGPNCDIFIPCRNPLQPLERADLIDRTTGSKVDPEEYTNIKLYEKIGANYRYYCDCKSMSSWLSGGYQPLSCVRDPAFAYTLSPPARQAIGTSDGIEHGMDPTYDCGEYSVTRLLGGTAGKPCMPIINQGDVNLAPPDILNGFRMFKCNESTETFIPCRNQLNPKQEGNICGANGVPMMMPTLAPEEGTCINTCAIANENIRAALATTPVPHRKAEWCAQDVRSVGVCEVVAYDTTQQFAGNKPVKCSKCHPAPNESWWYCDDPTGRGEPCYGRLPNCRTTSDKCDHTLHNSWRGPQCCAPSSTGVNYRCVNGHCTLR